jgi:hypothetical protein
MDTVVAHFLSTPDPTTQGRARADLRTLTPEVQDALAESCPDPV